ncbi:hypothetical protein C3986_04520 [Escherichia coli]|nr:hypothetical protein C3986_04520 [Escherichia coli]
MFIGYIDIYNLIVLIALKFLSRIHDVFIT